LQKMSLSKRAAAAPPPLPDAPPTVNYIGAHIAHLGDSEHVALAIAENKLSWDALHPLMHAAEQRATDSANKHKSSAGYDDPRGSFLFRQAFAAFLQREVFCHTAGGAGAGAAVDATERVEGKAVVVDPDCIVGGAGVTGVLQMLLFVLCDPGEGASL
jgi:aspartate/methionine/tyrosine aminotransferase